jgi:hypothetical protein
LSPKLYWISTTSSAEFCEISTNPQSSATADKEHMYLNEIKLFGRNTTQKDIKMGKKI